MKKFQSKERVLGRLANLSSNLSVIAVLALTACGGGGLRSSSGSGNVNSLGSSGSGGNAVTDVVKAAYQSMPKVDATCGLSNFQAEMLAQINARRAAGAVCGAKKMPAAASLAWNAQLQHAATLHAYHMAHTGVYSHTGSYGLTLPQRVNGAGYDYSLLGENIDAQRTSVQAAIHSWMSSPQHCENIMRTQFRDVGVSCVNNSASQWGNYWAMELGVRR
jgi:uncharacterized protein YkwD